MKRPAVFFDRDNTLIVNDGYLGNPAEVVLMDGAADAIARVRALGYAAVIFSNQSGVARGRFTEDAVHAVNARMDEMLLDQNPGAVIDRHEFCPFHPEGSVEAYTCESDLRKPRPGMIYQAADKLALDLSRSWVIGDAPRDIQAGKAAGCRTILFKNPQMTQSPTAMEQAVGSDFVVGTLAEASAMIEIATRTEPPAITSNDGDVARPPVTAEASATPAAPSPAAALAPLVTATSAQTVNGAADHVQPATRVAITPAVSRDTVKAETSGEPISSARIEALLQQLIQETRRNHEQPHTEFAVSKLMAGIVQILALAALFLAYLRHDTSAELSTLLYALTFQALTISLLIMGRQR